MDNINLQGKKIIVTGGNGFLGKNLVKALIDKGADVFVFDKILLNNFNEVKIDITNFEALNDKINVINPHIIFHLAAILNRERNFDQHDKIMKINYFGTINLLKALQNIDYENFIYISTSEIYGSNKAPFNEDMLPMPASPYSLSKCFAELAVKTFSEIHNKNFTILRLFNFYGKDMPGSFFVSQLINSLKNNDVFKMTLGEQKRDFIHINDVVNAMLLTASNTIYAKNEIFNVCTGNSISIKNLALQCKQLLKANCKIEFGALPYRENEIWDMTGDNSKIVSKLGFKINHDLSDLLNVM